MNAIHSKCRPVLFFLLVLAPVAWLTAAPSVSFYGLTKRKNFLQTSAATPVAHGVIGDSDGFTFHFDVQVEGTNLDQFSSIKLNLPNATQYALVNSDTMDNTKFGFGNSGTIHSWATKPSMDTAFANGTYSFDIGATNVALALTPDTYPLEVPTVTGGTWDAAGNLLINAATGATVTFNTFSSYTGSGFIGVNLYTVANGGINSPITNQSNINITGYQTDPLVTSISIAPNALLPGQIYYGELTFGRLTAADSTTFPGALGHADYEYLTGFLIRTIGSFNDFNNDGKADIVWENTTTGSRYIWFMNGTTVSSAVNLGVVPIAWRIAGTAPMAGTANTAILWENTSTGERYIWQMNGTTFSAGISLGIVSTDWRIAALADFNGDGNPDILWQNTASGDIGIWLMNGSNFSSWVYLGNNTTDWRIAAAGDFNGDGKTDIVWENTTTGQRGFWIMNGTTFSRWKNIGVVSTDWRIAAAGDFNNDGSADILWENTTSGDRGIWLMNGTAYSGWQDIGVVTTDWRIAP